MAKLKMVKEERNERCLMVILFRNHRQHTRQPGIAGGGIIC